MARSVARAMACAAAAVALQGCGSPSHKPEPVTQTTTTTTTTHIGPMPPQPQTPFKPLHGISYQSPPGKSMSSQLPGKDMMQAAYSLQWGPEGRDDLGMIRTMGSNAVRIYEGFGHEFMTDHKEFLDRAHELGLHVIVGFNTQNICPDFNCFATWKQAAIDGFKQGIAVDGAWHPAIKVAVLMDSPDYLNILSPDGTTVNCTTTEAECRTRAALSSLDGLLAAEEAAGIDGSNVSLTVAWSFAKRDSIDGKLVQVEGMYGFQDMMVAVKDPSITDYSPTADVQSAFSERWVHSMNAPSTWTYIKEKVADQYSAYEPTPWFISEFTPVSGVAKDLEDIEAYAKSEGNSFMGAVMNGFQKDYQRDIPSDTGFFGLGEEELGTVQPCEEDVRTKAKICAPFPVLCLDPAGGKFAADATAAWGGSTVAHGLCRATDSDESPSLLEGEGEDPSDSNSDSDSDSDDDEDDEAPETVSVVV